MQMTRLHVTAPLVQLANVRRIGILAVPGLLNSPAHGRAGAWAVYGAMLVLMIGGSIVEYLRFGYAFSGDALIVNGGLLFRWRRVVPFDRVQSVDVVRKLRHRVFGVVELRIEVMGGSKTEALFHALLPEEAERIRMTVLKAGRGSVAGPESGEPTSSGDVMPAAVRSADVPLAKMSIGDLLLFGATGGRVGVLALFIVQAMEFLPLESVTDTFQGARIGMVVVTGIFVLLVSLVVSLAMTVVAFWDFSLSRDGDQLAISCGLLDHRRSLVPLHRVQAVRLQENVVRRALGYASLRVVVAGQSGGDASERQERSVLLPIGRRQDAIALASQVLGADLSVELRRLDRASFRGVWRQVMWFLVFPTIPATAFAVVQAGPIGWGAAALILPLAGLSVMAWRVRGIRVGADLVVTRSGIFTYVTTVVPYANVQDLALQRTPLQRALRLGSVRFSLVKGTTAACRDLDLTGAEQAFEEVSQRVLRTHWVAAA